MTELNLVGRLRKHREAVEQQLREAITLVPTQINDAVLAERERCARIAHKYTRTFGGYSDSVERVAGDIEDEIRSGE